jgi:hypothetical protein
MTAIPHHETERMSLAHSGPGYNAYRVLQVAFVVAPLLAGIDKFTHVLVDWNSYVAPIAAKILGGHVSAFMMAVGCVEIIAGLGVAVKPKYFAYIVSAWLVLIIINLLLTGMYFDIALRDLGLCLAAFALGRLAMLYDVGAFGGLMTRRSAPAV